MHVCGASGTVENMQYSAALGDFESAASVRSQWHNLCRDSIMTPSVRSDCARLSVQPGPLGPQMNAAMFNAMHLCIHCVMNDHVLDFDCSVFMARWLGKSNQTIS